MKLRANQLYRAHPFREVLIAISAFCFLIFIVEIWMCYFSRSVGCAIILAFILMPVGRLGFDMNRLNAPAYYCSVLFLSAVIYSVPSGIVFTVVRRIIKSKFL